MDQQLYDKLFQEYVDYVVDIIRKKGIKTANDLKDIVRKNINRVDLRLARVVMVNNMRFGAFSRIWQRLLLTSMTLRLVSTF